eukprot:CAMPEP_0119040740 /NCGR_PEP_ID=MMETSP1177-20130426/10739_1 /TAXON_ID=2985 /ORGANISM="Ochromonas sp, Strain CCMP1899" /LENGTH=199 /DNA_ID=CAMNT_0007006057 /DNA_START=132 /DNA_END=731 /DNA_ORIENTATION=-
MGKDKYENEDLIKYGIPEDLWFHVDDLSSAHVYLRLQKDQRLEDVTDSTINECAQLVKANSIEGCKLKDVHVVYTRWRNLLKTGGMEAGQVSYNDKTKVKRIRVEKDNAIVNTLNRTKEERHPDLAALQEERAAEFRNVQKIAKREQLQNEKTAKKAREDAAKVRNYSSIMKEDKMKSNVDVKASVYDDAAKEAEDDFM